MDGSSFVFDKVGIGDGRLICFLFIVSVDVIRRRQLRPVLREKDTECPIRALCPIRHFKESLFIIQNVM